MYTINTNLIFISAVAVLGIALIAMGEDIGADMTYRSFGHLVRTVKPALNGHKHFQGKLAVKRQVALQKRAEINIKSMEIHETLIPQSDLTRQVAVQNNDRK